MWFGEVSEAMPHTIHNRAKILIVEDEADIQQVLCIYLEYSGFEVRGASNGQEAMRLIPEFCPQLIVLDLMMQPVNGWEVLNWLQVNHITPHLPVLVLTALVQLADKIHGFEQGAVEYLTKPTQPSVLVERIRSILAMSEEQQRSLREKSMQQWRAIMERLNAPPTDEFVY